MMLRRGNSKSETTSGSCLEQALAACRSGIVAVVVFSFCINILLLTGPLYMLQVFDRVIVSRSTDTLLFLSLAALIALVTLAGLELVRTKVMVTLSSWLEAQLSGRMLTSSVDTSLRQAGNPSVQGLRDLSTIRNFLTGPGMFPILDAPWTPVFLAVIFLMQPALGWLALAGAVVLLSLAIVNEFTTRGLLQRSGGAHIEAMQQAECAVRNASVIEAMGMKSNLVRRWQENNDKAVKFQALASLRAGRIAALSKMIRQGLQMGVLGFGAWFVLLGDMTPGVMIAASILMARALAPVDQAIGSWKSAVAARNAYQRVKQQFKETPESGGGLPLPTPLGAALCGDDDVLLSRYDRADAQRCEFPPGTRSSDGSDRTDGGRQDHVGRPDGGYPKAATGSCAAGRSRRSRLGLGGSGPSYRLSAPEYRAVRWHGCRQHRAARDGGRRRGDCRGEARRRARHDPASASRLSD